MKNKKIKKIPEGLPLTKEDLIWIAERFVQMGLLKREKFSSLSEQNLQNLIDNIIKKKDRSIK
jgi:hypothetical protein